MINRFTIEAAENGFTLEYCDKRPKLAGAGSYDNVSYNEKEFVYAKDDVKGLLSKVAELLNEISPGSIDGPLAVPSEY